MCGRPARGECGITQLLNSIVFSIQFSITTTKTNEPVFDHDYKKRVINNC